MENNENLTPEEITGQTSEIPEVQEENTWHGLGVGQRESLYDDPGQTVHEDVRVFEPEAAPDPEPAAIPPLAEESIEKKKAPRRGKRVLAAVLALAILIGACGITAAGVNRRWEKKTAQLEDSFTQQLEQLRQQVSDAAATASQALGASSGISVSGSPLGSGDSLTPAQVYAANVNSVVSVSNFMKTAGNGNLQLAGTGSGFIISEDGYVVTNCHVVEGASSLSVTTHSGEEYSATLVGYDEINDVALLKMDATGLDAVELGSSTALIVGDMVVAIGNPLGELTATQTVGYISGKDRAVSTDGTVINMLQTDAAINSGNSGGPLFNMKGQVIGITTAKYSGSSSSGATIEGIGFAIPIDDIISMIDDFKAYGYVRNQAYLGVNVIDMDASTASIYSLPVGSYVQNVVENGSADKAGILPQDIIIAVGGYTVTGNSSLTTTLRKFSAGDTTTITVFRAGQELELTITFDERPQDVNADQEVPVEPGDMPSNGSFDEWYDYFFRNYGFGGNG